MTSPRAIRPSGPSRTISDGAHAGNPNVFFLPPMVANPVGKPGYGDAFASGLAVEIRVLELASGGVVRDFPPSSVTMSLTDQAYEVNWDTKATTLDPTKTYRVQVLVGTKVLAFADVDVVSNGSELKNASTGDAIPLVDGRTLPIKVRIEQGWDVCLNDAACVSQVVPATIPSGTTVKVTTGGSNEDYIIFQGGANGTWNNLGQAVVVTIEDVSQALGGTPEGCAQNLTALVIDGHCMKITTDPQITLTAPAVVCMTIPTASRDWQMLKYNVGETTKFLSDEVGGACPMLPTIGSTNQSVNPFVRLASFIGSGLRRLVTPRLAYAFDLGVGGTLSSGDGFSFFAPGYNATVSKDPATDNQSGPAGAALSISPAVVVTKNHSHLGDPVTNAKVTCVVTGGGGSVASSGIATEDPQQPAEWRCPAWTLGPNAGSNALAVTVKVGSATIGTLSFSATGVPVSVPTPVLALKNFDPEATLVTYNLTVTNRANIPDALFSQYTGGCAPDQATSSRTWVDIYDGASHQRLYGFCQLSSAADLDQIWVAVGATLAQPASLYITLTDRATNTVYTSNTIAINTAPVLALKSIETSGGTRYNLTVTNGSIYSDQLFRNTVADNLPWCGEVNVGSNQRTWVTVYDASNDAELESFCGFSSAADLDGVWFFVATNASPPAAVYLKLHDRLLNQDYTSNILVLTPQ